MKNTVLFIKYAYRRTWFHLFGNIHLSPPNKPYGYVLLSYLTEPFLLRPNQQVSNFHSNYWECREMANYFLKRGFAVDIISEGNQTFTPHRDYAVFIDINRNMDRLSPLLNKDCIKIALLTGAHWLFQNNAEYTRLLGVQSRRKKTLIPRRVVPPVRLIENADCGIFLGNDFTKKTYLYAGKNLYRVPVSSPTIFEFPHEKDFAKARTSFLYFAGGGMTHKGLDLVLEAFTQMPDFKLFVCAPVKREEDFNKEYGAELYETGNIKTLGRVEITSDVFLTLIDSCSAVVFPSSSEGGGGSVINCMHAGLIPIVSKEASVDVGNYGILLPESTIESIIEAAHLISQMSPEEIKGRSQKAWSHARRKHTREKFSENYQAVMDNILKQYEK